MAPTQGRLVDCHVLIDYSNVQRVIECLQQLLDTVRRQLLANGARGSAVRSRVVAGSGSRTALLWQHWAQQGFGLLLEERGGPEVFVDEALHSAAHRILMDNVSGEYARRHPSVRRGRSNVRRVTDNAQHLVLITGDANDTDHATTSSFPRVIEDAVHRGWTVEVWCNRDNCPWLYTDMADHGDIALNFVDSLLPEPAPPLNIAIRRAAAAAADSLAQGQ